MNIYRGHIELNDLFEFQSEIVQVIAVEPLPESQSDNESWKESVLNSNVTVKYLRNERTITVKIGSLKQIPLWIPSADFTKLLGFSEVEFSDMPSLQVEEMNNILLFKILFSDEHGMTTGTSYATSTISEIDKIKQFHDNMNVEVLKEFEKEFTPIVHLNSLLSALKLNSVSYDLNLISDFFYQIYLPARLDLSRN